MFNRILLILFILFIVFMLGWCTRQPARTTDTSAVDATSGTAGATAAGLAAGAAATAGSTLDAATTKAGEAVSAAAEGANQATKKLAETAQNAGGAISSVVSQAAAPQPTAETATAPAVEEPAPRPEDFIVSTDAADTATTAEATMENGKAGMVEEKLGAMLSAASGDADAASLVLEGVNFRTNSDQLTPDSIAVLDVVIADLKKHETIIVEIAGYTDNTGDPAYNVALSERRAQAVVDYLVKGGIDAGRLSAKGYGAASPIADNATAEGRQKNRRVEMHVIK